MTHMMYEDPDRTPAPPASEGTGELRDALMEHFASVLSLYVGDQLPDAVADLLAVPPVVSLLAKVQAVEALADELESESQDAMRRADEARERNDRVMYPVNVRHSRVAQHTASALRRALGGTR